MKKKQLIIGGILVLLIVGGVTGWLIYSRSSGDQTAQLGTGGTGEVTLETKLAIGILTLEDGDQAISSEQAKTLLPLWQAVRALSSSNTASQVEIDALYAQIEEVLTKEQIATIEAFELNQDSMAAITEKYGIQAGFGQGRLLEGMDEDQMATRQAQMQAGGGLPPGGFVGEGVIIEGGAGALPGGGGNGFGRISQTPGITTGSNRMAFGFNLVFIDPLIEMLEEKAQG
ncbi:MAG: hypothetical protein HPY76_12085 [Anaerolineae bacterium]|nr:hypothetical protein [Anaerolineae bacterium]